MNQSNNKLISNNKTIVNKNTRKLFFALIIISGIIALIILLGIFFLVNKTSSKNKQTNELTKVQEEKKHSSSSTDKEDSPKINSPSKQNPILPSDKENCPYLNESNLTTNLNKWPSRILVEEELFQWRKIPSEFIIKNWKKGYHWWDILHLWNWKLSHSEIPDLIGVINSLSYLLGIPAHILYDENIPKEEKIKMHKEDRFGMAKSLVVIVRKIPNNGPIINIDKGVQGASPYGYTLKYVKKLINFILNQENINLAQTEIFLLNCVGGENFDRKEFREFWSIGKSFGSAIYLAFLSALYQKPIAKSVAATGVVNTSKKKQKGKINEQEINLVQGDNLPIAGLKGKSYGAVEKGISRLVLSTYNTSPRLLSFSYKSKSPDRQVVDEKWGTAEDYSKVVPPEIRKKLTVHWTKNMVELKELLFSGKLD